MYRYIYIYMSECMCVIIDLCVYPALMTGPFVYVRDEFIGLVVLFLAIKVSSTQVEKKYIQ